MSAETYILNEERPERSAMLMQLRDLVRRVLGTYEETMDYNMPTYFYNSQCICAFASQKNYMALYIMPYDLLTKFEERLKKFDMGKSCIRFNKIEVEDLSLFEEILMHCKETYSKSRFYGKMNPKK